MYIVKINPREEILYLLSCVKKTQILQFYRFVKKKFAAINTNFYSTNVFPKHFQQ